MGRQRGDLTAAQLLAVVRPLPDDAPVTDKTFASKAVGASFKHQWVGWLRELGGPGYYGRRKPVTSARAVYTRLQSPRMLLWLCEQLGARKSEVGAARKLARGADNGARAARAIREAIPWSRVLQLLEARMDASHGSGSRKSPGQIRSRRQLRAAISRLSPRSPHTDRFSAEWRRTRGGEKERAVVWYRTQHEHWLGWLAGYEGPGAYDRANWHRSAEYVYNHIVNPQMLIYLAEAIGIDDRVVREASKAGLARATSTMSSMSAAIRRVVPWEVVEPRLRKTP